MLSQADAIERDGLHRAPQRPDVCLHRVRLAHSEKPRLLAGLIGASAIASAYFVECVLCVECVADCTKAYHRDLVIATFICGGD